MVPDAASEATIGSRCSSWLSLACRRSCLSSAATTRPSDTSSVAATPAPRPSARMRCAISSTPGAVVIVPRAEQSRDRAPGGQVEADKQQADRERDPDYAHYPL